MKILLIIPPYVPSYFNAGHHLPLFQVAAYLDRKYSGATVDVFDFGALNASWRDVCRVLQRKHDVIAAFNDFDGVDGFARFLSYVSEISPDAKTMTFGRASRECGGFFDQFGFDVIHTSGDYEPGVESFIDHCRDGRPLVGCRARRADGSYAEALGAGWLPVEEWALPDVTKIPYAAYDALYKDDLNRFCGIPERRELVVPTARGCPVGCSFCDVPKQQGLKERRLSVDSVLAYIEEANRRVGFEYVSFYAPTFTLKRAWVEDLCGKITAHGPRFNWKCVTTMAHLGEDIIATMARAGCVRISVGVESFSPAAGATLPKMKRESKEQLEHISAACAANGVELNCFLMFGLDGEPIEEAVAQMHALTDRGLRVRTTVYTPYERIKPDMSIADFQKFNRQLLLHLDISPEEKRLAYAALFDDEQNTATTVQGRITTAAMFEGRGDARGTRPPVLSGDVATKAL